MWKIRIKIINFIKDLIDFIENLIIDFTVCKFIVIRDPFSFFLNVIDLLEIRNSTFVYFIYAIIYKYLLLQAAKGLHAYMWFRYYFDLPGFQ